MKNLPIKSSTIIFGIVCCALFASNPSVYTLPGTWEAQPFIPVELVFSTTVAVASLGLVVGLIAGISIIKIRRKRV